MIRTERHDRVALVTIDRSERRNALDTEHCRLLHEAVHGVAGDGARVVVITGAGRAFCAGADLSAGAQTFDYERRGGEDRAARTVDGLQRDGGGVAQQGRTDLPARPPGVGHREVVVRALTGAEQPHPPQEELVCRVAAVAGPDEFFADGRPRGRLQHDRTDSPRRNRCLSSNVSAHCECAAALISMDCAKARVPELAAARSDCGLDS